MWEQQRAFALTFRPAPRAAPWCGHCKRLEPALDFLDKELVHNARLPDPCCRIRWPAPFNACRHAQVAKGNAHVLAKVDAVAESKLASHWGVSGYPTLMLFRDGEFFETYSGARATPPIKTFLEGHISGEAMTKRCGSRATPRACVSGNSDRTVCCCLGVQLKSEIEGELTSPTPHAQLKAPTLPHSPIMHSRSSCAKRRCRVQQN